MPTAFRPLAEDVCWAHAADAEICERMERAQDYGCLALADLEKRLCSRIVEALQSAAENTLQGRIEDWRPHDENGRRQYLQTLTELLDLIKQQAV
jgi:hypothetical protein